MRAYPPVELYLTEEPTCDEFVATLVERAISQRQDVRSEDLEQKEVRGFIRLQLLDQFWGEQDMFQGWGDS